MDDKLSRKGHRQRVKDAYLKGSLETMPDHNLLELVLFYAIPQKDVKPLSYTLINHFGSLDKVFNASIEDLMMVDGVKEHTAILLSLFKSVNMRISQNNANEEIKLSSFEKISEFAANMLKDQKVENFLVITVASDDTIINSRIVSKGDVKTTGLKKKQLAELAIRDNAAGIILAHNHPQGSPNPSTADIHMTQNACSFMREIGLSVIDHVIVGKDGSTVSLKSDIKYAQYFP